MTFQQNNTVIVFSSLGTPLGTLLCASSPNGICHIQFEKSLRNLRKAFPDAEIVPLEKKESLSKEEKIAKKHLTRLLQETTRYFEGKSARLDAVPIDIRRGTAFQRKVWQALRQVESGQTASYGDIAKAIGRPKSARAVGAACGANPVVLAVPCHRIVGQNGALTGFSAGLNKKKYLLGLEA